MNAAYVSALAALAGSVIGGLTTGVATWLTQRAQVRAGQIEHKITQLENLFTDFIVAASKTYGEGLVTNEPKIEEIVALYAMISKIVYYHWSKLLTALNGSCTKLSKHITSRTRQFAICMS